MVKSPCGLFSAVNIGMLHFIKSLKESNDNREIYQEKLNFGKDELAPVMSEDTVKYHYDGLAAKYSERYNAGEGDPDFNYGGAVLHNIWFTNLTPARAANKPEGVSKSIIDAEHGSFEKFKEAVEKTAMGIQGSGWVYMDTAGKLHVIPNHEYKKNMKIALLIDWWDHAWALDYQQDKAKYLTNIWRIINWDTVNIRLQGA
jgi:Fe-Mn family superoxide dismutase